MKIKYEREQRGAKVFTKNEFVEKEKWFEKDKIAMIFDS